MWSGILLLGLLGYLFNAVFTLVERRVLAWHYGARGRALETQPMLKVTNLSKTYGTGEHATQAIARPLLRGRSRASSSASSARPAAARRRC